MKEPQWSFAFFLLIFCHFLLIIIRNDMFWPGSCVHQFATKWENTFFPQRVLSLIQELLTNFKQENKENHSYTLGNIQFSLVQLLSRVWLCDLMDCSMPGLPVHHQLPEFTQTQCPLTWWCHPTVSSSVVPYSSRLQSFLASGSFQMSQLFELGGQCFRVSALASVLPMSVQD